MNYISWSHVETKLLLPFANRHPDILPNENETDVSVYLVLSETDVILINASSFVKMTIKSQHKR